MNLEEAQQLSEGVLRELPSEMLIDILEKHIEEDCSITFDDSETQIQD